MPPKLPSTQLKLAPEKEQFLISNLEAGLTPTIISRAFLRRFGTPCAPSLIESLRPQLLSAKVSRQPRESVEKIRDKLTNHSDELGYLRNKLLERIDEPDVTNNELVNLSREYRSNIQAEHAIASMTDISDGKTQFVLFYGDTNVASSPDANIEDAEFVLLGDDPIADD